MWVVVVVKIMLLLLILMILIILMIHCTIAFAISAISGQCIIDSRKDNGDDSNDCWFFKTSLMIMVTMQKYSRFIMRILPDSNAGLFWGTPWAQSILPLHQKTLLVAREERTGPMGAADKILCFGGDLRGISHSLEWLISLRSPLTIWWWFTHWHWIAWEHLHYWSYSTRERKLLVFFKISLNRYSDEITFCVFSNFWPEWWLDNGQSRPILLPNIWFAIEDL